MTEKSNFKFFTTPSRKLQLILSLAKQVTTEKRNDIQQALNSSLLDGEQQKPEPPEIQPTDLLAEIEELHQEIEARIESIEDGTYWDAPDEDDWDDSYYHDENPDMLNGYQIDALAEYFSKADHYFIKEDKKEAKDIYGALFTLMSDAEEYGYDLPDIKINLREAGARFARCVYELSSENARLDAMLTDQSDPIVPTSRKSCWDYKVLTPAHSTWSTTVSGPGILGRKGSTILFPTHTEKHMNAPPLHFAHWLSL